MPPKKPDPKDAKGKVPGGAGAGPAGLLVDDDYADLPTLPPLNNFIFTTLAAFKYKRNLLRIHQALLKHYNFTVEETAGSPQTLARYKTVQREDILNYARAKNYITEEELVATLPLGTVGDI